MDSFDGLLPALFSLLSNHRTRGSQPHNLPARSPCLDHYLAASSNSAGGGGGGSSSELYGADNRWKLLRQSSINSITDSARGCLAGLPFWPRPATPTTAAGSTGLYAKLRSKMERKVLLSSARLNCALNATTHHQHIALEAPAPSDGDFYQALAGGYP